MKRLIRWIKNQFPRTRLVKDGWPAHLANLAVKEANDVGLRWTLKPLPYGRRDLAFYYRCEKCDTDLTCGPSGGGTNMVCEHCHINYGCLPGSEER